jgi:hypothetical protein
MNKIHNSALEAKVAAVNAVNAESNRMLPILISFFAPFVGKKIAISGGMIKKIRDNLPKVGEGFRMYCDSNYGSTLRYVISRDETYKYPSYNPHFPEDHHSSQRAENTLYIGEYNRAGIGQYGCDLEKVTDYNEFKPWRTDYTVVGVIAARKALETAENAVSSANRNLHPFEKYDRR